MLPAAGNGRQLPKLMLFASLIDAVSIRKVAMSIPGDQEKDAISINFRIGQHVKEVRKDQKMTQAALAEAAGISIPYYRQLERGERRWNFELALKVANALDLSVSGILPLDYMGRSSGPPQNSHSLRPAVLQLLGAVEAEQWTDAFISLAELARESRGHS